MSKRGQVTVFIIIGIVILLAAIAIFFIRSYVVERQITEVARPIEQLPTEMEPLRSFTESCLRSVGEQALIRLGQQGGYIYPDTWDSLSFDEKNPTNSDGLTFPGSELKLPYWWYNQAKNEQKQILLASKQPSLEKMQNDLARFVTLELPACLNNYTSFKPSFDIAEEGFSTTVNIGPQNVKFLVTHPLTIQKGPATAEINSFYTEIPVKLKHMYEIASLITESQQNYSFLEQHTMNLIEIYSGLDEQKLPPTTDNSFETSSSLRWKKTDVINDLKLLFMGYVPFLRYYNSRNYYSYQFTEDVPLRDMQQRVYNNMILPLSGAEDLDVRFQYLDLWQPYVSFNAEGEYIEPSSVVVDFWLDKFGWQNFNTVYDISYPVFVSLYSPESLENQGYFFNFALETNIRNNAAVEQDQALSGLMSAYETSLLCRPEQRNSGNITVRAIDAYSRLPLSQAAIYFSDGEETCTLGYTDEHGLLITPFPVMIGGLVSASKDNYLSSFSQLNTELGQPDFVELNLWQLKEVKVSAIKKKIYNCKKKDDHENCYFTAENITLTNPLQASLVLANQPGIVQAHTESISDSDRADTSTWYFSNGPFDLKETEEVIIIAQRVSASEPEFVASSSFQGTATESIRLAPGTYELQIFLIANENLTIPEERRCPEDNCFVFNKTNIQGLPLGGLVWKNTTLWTLKPSDLYAANQVNFILVSPALTDVPESARVIEDLNQVTLIEGYSTKFKTKLKPYFT